MGNNKIGGYQLIDLQHKDITKATYEIPGIYDLIEGTSKPILITGITIDGIEKQDVYVQPRVNESAYEFELYGNTIIIDDNNTVKKISGIVAERLTGDAITKDGLYVVTVPAEGAKTLNISNCVTVIPGYLGATQIQYELSSDFESLITTLDLSRGENDVYIYLKDTIAYLFDKEL